MRRLLVRMRWLGAVLFVFSGCQQFSWWYKPDVPAKPPLHEEYVLPPTDDARFSSPPAYPKETMDNGLLKKDQSKPGDQFKGAGRFGASGPGMGGY